MPGRRRPRSSSGELRPQGRGPRPDHRSLPSLDDAVERRAAQRASRGLRLEQRRPRQARREIAQRRLAARIRQSHPQRRRVPVEALTRVPARRAGRDQKGPVAALQSQQLAHRPVAHRRPGGDHVELGGARGPGQVGDPRARPGREVAASPRSSRARRPRRTGRIAVGQRVVEVDELEPAPRRLRHHELQPLRALVPPMPEQLGVQRADAQPAVAHAPGHPRHEIGGIVRRLWPRAPGRRRRRRWPTGGGRARCGGGGRGRPRATDSRSAPTRGRRPRDRWAPAAGPPGGQGAQVARIARAEDVGEVDARRVHAGLFQQPVQPRRAGALRTKPPRQPSPKRARCDSTPVRTCRRTPASVAKSGSSAWVAALVHAANGASAARRSSGRRSSASAYSPAARSSSAATAGAPAASMSSSCDAGRTSRRKARQRSSAPGASSWSHSTGVRLGAPRAAGRAAAGRRSGSPPTATPAERPRPRSPRRMEMECRTMASRPPVMASARPRSPGRDRGRARPKGEVARGMAGTKRS